MSVTSLVKKSYNKMNVNPGKAFGKGHGLLDFVGDLGVSAGTGFLLGEIHGRYREKANVMGVPATLATAIGAKALVLGSNMMFNGKGTDLLNNIGNVALGSYAFAKGVSHGTEASGRKLLLLDKGQAVPAGLKPTTVVGAIPPAPTGDYLTPEETAHFARQR